MAPPTRTYPVEAEVEVWVSALDPNEVRTSWMWAHENGSIDGSVSLETFSAGEDVLLEALLGDPGRLDLWLKREALHHLVDMGIEAEPLYTREEDIFAPVISTLADPYRQHFERAVRREEFHEYAQALFLAVQTSVTSIALAEDPRTRRDGQGALVRRDIRVRIEVAGRVEEIDLALARETWDGMPRWSEANVRGLGWKRWIGAQQRLREALLENRASLDLWLSLEALRDVAELDTDAVRIPPEGGHLLHGLVPVLPDPARAYFEDGILSGSFYDRAADVHHNVGSRVARVSVAGVPAGPGPLVG